MHAKHLVLLSGISALALAGCDSSYLSESGSKTQQGAVAGALVGGLFGATRKGDDKLAKAATGALVGAAIGGAIGTSLDRQAKELDQEISNDQVRIVNTGSQLVVTMPEGILFPVDSAVVNTSIRNDLYAVADSLNRYPNTRVEVVGHTDNTGSASYNQDLSQRRAAAVGDVLRGAGVTGARIVTYGRGENAPIASNLTPEGRAQNRRVEIFIIPNT